METILNKLNIARKELLDLSFRNPLLNFKLRKTTGIEFANINTNDLYEYLVSEEKACLFTKESSLRPNRIQVTCDEKELRSRLIQTYRQATMFIEEKGANTLFLALGFLKWEEEGQQLRSPLVLVPVELKKADNSDRYSMLYSNDDIKFNVSLQTKMAIDYGIKIPSFEQDELDLSKYYRTISEVVSHLEGWEVEYNGALDFFSYGKYLMYQDLDIEKWVNNGKLINDKIMKGLFVEGFHDKLSDESSIDINQITKPRNFYHVVDADSSQALAIYDVNNGSNLVMQGPPGTGKSQTITNLIANSVALGKSVLFVSEKASALEVVQRRLKSVGLNDLTLELHSNKANKKDVLKALEATVNLGEPKVEDANTLYEKYDNVRDSLNMYKDAVNKPVLKSNLSPLNIYGDLLRLKDNIDKDNVRMPHIEFKGIAYWTDEEFQKRYDVTKEFLNVAKLVGKLEKHPFYGVGLKKCLPYEQVAIKEKIIYLDESLIILTKAINDLTKLLGYHSLDNIFEANHMSYSIDECSKGIDLKGINAADYRFVENPQLVSMIIKTGIKGQKLYSMISNKIDRKFLKDFSFIQIYEAYKMIKFPHFRKKKAAFKEIKNYLGCSNINTIDAFYQYLQVASFFKKEKKNVRDIFLSSYQGIIETDWVELEKIVSFVEMIHSRIARYEILPQMKNVLMDDELLEKVCIANEDYKEKLNNFIACLDKVLKSMDVDVEKRFLYPKWYLDTSFSDFKKIINSFLDTDKIIEIVRYNEVAEKMINYELDGIVELSSIWKYKLDYLCDLLEYERLKCLIDTAFQESESLQQFKKFNHERQIEMFKELDISIMVENIKFILKKHWENCPRINDNNPQMNILRREFQKKKNQMPIRKLMGIVGDEIKKIKPVFMMSPLSIATYIEPGKMTFDLVVFDEASQVRPVEAFGALLRANQVVVVGDSHQLPPTNFFDTMTTKFEGLTDEDYDFSNMESILSLLLAKNIPQRTLNWHYRSRHKSLIMISNQEFYNNSLCLFPSVDDRDINEGLVFRYLPNTAYQRGKSRSNPKEAKEVIKAVMEHAAKYPHLSLGVVSFSMAQADEIYNEFEKARKRNDSKEIENYFHMHETEPFFIKNLENVQGDERDVIFISVGYGHDETGNLTMDFGPLNKDGGERRLNVLITRARTKTEIFSNITGYDINLAKTNSKGVMALKKYLDYAQNRQNYDERNHSTLAESFTTYIYNRLLEYGFMVERNVGVSGFGIDLAIADPVDPSHFLLGIECDGGAYKNQNSATDRERLRSAVLTNLGWKIYHLWTTDFYRNPKVEFEKLLNYINNIAHIKVSSKQPVTIDVKRHKAERIEKTHLIIDYKMYNGPKRRASIIDEIETLKQLVVKIIDCESPIHKKEIMKRIQGITQISKITEKMKKNINCAIDGVIFEYDYRDGFIYKRDQEILVRRRNMIENKRMEFVPIEEVKLACHTVIDLGLATTIDEIKTNVGDIFGFNKTNTTLVTMINSQLEKMIKEETIYIENEMYYINEYKDIE